MHLPLTFGITDYWNQLSPGTRDGIVSGLIVALVVAAVGLFWRLLKPPKQIEPKPAPVPTAPQQEVKVQVEVVPPAPAPTPPAQPEPPQPFKSPHIPRPPLFGFVARRGEDGRDIVERVKEELAPERNQLIVLWGSGGVGKTTLAAEACSALLNLFPGGIAWISADGKPDFGLSTLLDEIATHLRRPELRQLALQLKDQKLHDALVDCPTPLIVLDNFETISPPEQEFCAAWLAKRASCPALITSRDEAPHARPIHILAMSQLEAAEFLQKLVAEARKPKAFEELDHDRLIQAADRIPLVLEWLVRQIDAAKEPKRVLEDLAHGRGDAAQRVFDRSFELEQTGDDGRATLLALSLFVPSASRHALAEVAGFGNDVDRLEKALQQLDELWLIETIQQNQRIGVQGLTRQLALARLRESRDSETIRKRFVSYFLGYARANADPAAEDYEALESERDNLLAAMDVAFEIEDWKTVTRLAYVIALPASGVLSVHGYWDEALRRNEQALQAARKSSSEEDVGNFTHNQAVMHQNRGELEEARRLYDESREINKKLGNQGSIALTLHELGRLAQAQGDLKEAQQLYNEGLEINKKLGKDRGIALTLHELGRLAQAQGELDDARCLYNESLEIKKKLGDQSGIANTLHEVGRLAQAQGELDDARRLYNESLEIKKKLGNQSGIANTLHELGRLSQAQGDLETARRLYHESLEIEKKLGKQIGIARSLGQLGLVCEDQGDIKEATRLLREALTIFKELGSPDADIARQHLARVEGKSS